MRFSHSFWLQPQAQYVQLQYFYIYVLRRVWYLGARGTCIGWVWEFWYSCIALQRIKFWTSGQWKMVYALTDDSAVKQRAVKNAFPTAVDSDIKNHLKKHFLCTVHSERTLKRRFGSSELRKCFDELWYAMFCHTEAHCLTHIHEAIAAVPLPDVKNHQRYIEREWLATRTQWAMYAWQHNKILL